MTSIFISHSSADNVAAAEMKAWLEAQGHVSLFLDFDPEHGIAAGAGWEQTLYRKLRQCQAVIALLSPAWLASKWCFAELVQARERGKAIFIAKIAQIDTSGVFGDLQHIDLAARPEDGYERLRIGLLDRGLDPVDAFDWNPRRPPYPGLLAFEEQDAAIFFGRGDDIARTIETLDSLRRKAGDVSRFVLLLGASGSGKSSLARAGVIPRLKKRPAEWLAAPPLRPQIEPLDELAMALATRFESLGRPLSWNTIRQTLIDAAERTPADSQALLGLTRELAIAAQKPETTVLLTIDQAEELFGYTPPQAARRFLRLLRAALETGDQRLMVMATMRSDFLGEFQSHPDLQDQEYGHHLQYRAVPVDPMPLRGFAEVIRGPARLAGLELEDGLVEAMVGDAGTRDALPLLAFALRRLYERSHDDGRLTLQDYEVIGRLEGAVRHEAERLIADANPTPEELDALHAAFVPTMVRINAEGGYARRRALVDQMPRRVLTLLKRFVDARLLISDRDAQGRETNEVAHEALLRTWPQLSEWLLEDRDKLRLLESLQRAAEEWDLAGRRADLLVHRDSRLADAESMLGSPRFGGPEDSVERTYLDACRVAQDARDAADRAEQERRIRDAERIAEEQTKVARAQQRLATNFRRFSVAATALMCIAVVAAVVAYRQYTEANEAHERVGEVQQLARHTGDIDAKPQRSLLLSVRGALLGQKERSDALTALDGLRQQLKQIGGFPLQGHAQATRVAAFSSDRRWLATGSDDGAIRTWDMQTVDPTKQSRLLAGHQGAVAGLAFSSDGRWLVSGGSDGTVRLWPLEPSAPAGAVLLGGRHGPVRALAISPDGLWLAVGTQAGNLCIWSMTADGAQEQPCTAWKDNVPVTHVVFSPKGRWLATTCTGDCAGDNAPVRVWAVDAEFPHQPPRKLVHRKELTEPSLMAIAFNGDDSALVAAYGYVAEIWNLTKPDPPADASEPYASGGGWIQSVALSPDKRWLAVGSGSSLDVHLWDLIGGSPKPIVLRGHHAAVRSVQFSADSRWLASSSDDATVRLWDMTDGRLPVTVLRGQDLAVARVVFPPGPEPAHMVAVGDDPQARLWTIPEALADPVVMRATGVPPTIIGMDIAADGHTIATSSLADARIVLWDSGDPRKPKRELSVPGASHAITFSADGRWLAAKSQDEHVISLWSLKDASAEPVKLFERHWGDVRTLKFSPDGRWLVSGTWGNGESTISLWDVSKDRPSLKPRYRCRVGEPVREPSFSADSRFLATAAHGLRARIWDLGAPDPCAQARTLPHDDVVYQVMFSPDGHWAASASMDKRGRLWDLTVAGEPKLVRELSFNDRAVKVAFSSDNRWVAFSSWDGTSRMMSLPATEASPVVVLAGHVGRISATAFTPDGRWLATAGEDGSIRLWDPERPAEAPLVLRGHEANVAHIGFSKDGRSLFTAAYDGTLRQWRLDLADLMQLACRVAGRALTDEEVARYVPSGRAAQPCKTPS